MTEKPTEPPPERPKASPHLKERVGNFFRKGEHKLRVALNADLTEHDPATDTVCVICQTAVEFYFKPFLLANKQKYKKYGHDIREAFDKCRELDPSFDILIEPCNRLRDYRSVVEYELGADGFPSIDQAIQAGSDAQAVQAFVAGRLKALGFLDD